MNENERSSSRTRENNAVPYLISVRHMSKQPVRFSPRIKHDINILGDIHRSLSEYADESTAEIPEYVMFEDEE